MPTLPARLLYLKLPALSLIRLPRAGCAPALSPLERPWSRIVVAKAGIAGAHRVLDAREQGESRGCAAVVAPVDLAGEGGSVQVSDTGVHHYRTPYCAWQRGLPQVHAELSWASSYFLSSPSGAEDVLNEMQQ
jgi:hypothetical protein